jgi:hypothetical protein
VEILLLLNNDIAVLRPDWMSVMVAHAVQPGVGAVGAKLLYQDGRVQHAGLATDLRGVPRHLFPLRHGRWRRAVRSAGPGAQRMERMERMERDRSLPGRAAGFAVRGGRPQRGSAYSV